MHSCEKNICKILKILLDSPLTSPPTFGSMKAYTVKQVAQLAGVSIRTLHHYDRLGLLKPSVRTEARYRLYGEPELMRLQQILFYKELDVALHEIKAILDDPDFDQRTALETHKQAIMARRDRLTALLTTLDKTISTLNNKSAMMTDEELYAGFPKGREYRHEAANKYGEETVSRSEAHLKQMGKAHFEQLKAEQQDIAQTLAGMVAMDPASASVQQQMARHYANIVALWGNAVPESKRLEVYKGLGQLYVDDPRYTTTDGVENPTYAEFLRQAMTQFVSQQSQ